MSLYWLVIGYLFIGMLFGLLVLFVMKNEEANNRLPSQLRIALEMQGQELILRVVVAWLPLLVMC